MVIDIWHILNVVLKYIFVEVVALKIVTIECAGFYTAFFPERRDIYALHIMEVSSGIPGKLSYPN